MNEPEIASRAYVRPSRLHANEILDRLPQRIGTPSLNIRSRAIHLRDPAFDRPDEILSADDASRLYLKLSNDIEAWPKEATYDAVQHLAACNSFDPVKEYLERVFTTAEPLPLEQWRRLDKHLLGIDDPIAAAFLPQFLISAVARTFSPGCSVRRTPVLIGPQWRGKTALGRILFGPDHWVEGIHGGNDRDVRTRCHTAWGIELAELNGITRKRDQEELKAFLTECTDVLRRVYARGEDPMPRRFVFWATSNSPPLRDATGATRFVCIQLPDRMLPLDWATEHRDAIWSRAVELYRANTPWDEATQEERAAIAERNDEHRESHPWEERVAVFLAHRKTTGPLPVKVPEVLAHLGVSLDRQDNRAAATVRELAELVGWRHCRKWIDREEGDRPRGLWPPSEDTPGHSGDTPGAHRQKPAPDSDLHPGTYRDTPKEKEVRDEDGGTVGPFGVSRAAQTPKPAPGLESCTVGGVSHGRSQRPRDTPARPPSAVDAQPALLPITPAPIGSGADAMDDDDDSHWAPRRSAA